MPSLERNTQRKYMRPRRSSTVVNSSGNQSLYNSHRWRKQSKAYRAANPLCEVASSSGEVMATNVVDHIIPVSAGGSVWDRRNWMPMSHHYHNRKRGHERHGLSLGYEETESGLVPTDRAEVYALLIKPNNYEQ